MPFSLSGLSVFTPLGLWALLALVIPVLIHLFNRSRGRLVRIGHIDLIRQARRLKVTEVKLAQWILLLLRLGIFTLAALILAGLARPGLVNSQLTTAYVTPGWLRAVQPANISELLSSSQYERILMLQPDFSPLNMTAANEIRQTTLNDAFVTNIWPLLADRLSLEHHAGSVDVYATDLLLQYGDSKPTLPRAVSWQIAQPEKAPELRRLPTSVTVAYDMQRKQDAALINAALASLKSQRIPELNWVMTDTRDINTQQLNADWLILLSDSELTAEQLELTNTPTTILMDAVGDPVNNSLQYVTLPFYPFSSLRLNTLTQSLDDARTVVTTTAGAPVLQEYTSGPARILRYNSRFNPQWSSITQQAEFPELLLHLMLSNRQQTGAFNDARVNIEQLVSDSEKQVFDIPLPRRPLQRLLAVLLVLLWVTERWLSERKNREVS